MRIWVVVVAAGCGGGHKGIAGDAHVDVALDTAVDATMVDAAPDSAVDAAAVLGTWGAPAEVMTPGGAENPTLTADMLELYFDITPTIYVMKRATANDPWGSPAAVTELSGAAATFSPEITGDGLTMYLTRRTNPTTQEDIYLSTRPDRQTAWSAPAKVTELSTNGIELAATATDDLRTLVMSQYLSGQSDLFMYTRAATTDPWGTPTSLDTVNSALDDSNPMLSPDQKTLYFGSTIGGGGDLYVATRATTADAFSAPQPISELNSDFNFDGEPWVSRDGRDIYFSSQRSGPSGLYHATR